MARLNTTWAGQNGDLPDLVAFDLPDERVRQILVSSPSREEVISTTIRELRLELAHYVDADHHLTVQVAHLTLSARARALRRQLERLEEELEAHRIDRLLGLA